MFPRPKFHVHNRNNLWKDSDDEEDNNPSNIEVIDLSHSPEQSQASSNIHTTVMATVPDELPFLLPPAAASVPSVSSSSSSSFQQPQQRERQQQSIVPYLPRTLQHNSRRYSILPAFPTSFYNDQPPLLLANVPINKLNQEQLVRRRHGTYSLAYTSSEMNFDIPSYFRSHYQSFMSALIYQYNVDEPILDYNLYRFSECFRTFADDYIRRHKYHAEQFELNEKQKKYALEFYLQIDVDLFFMKTCAFRNAKPRSTDEGLFCIDEPDSRYGLSPCNNCPLCVPSYDMTRRQQPTIRFGPSQKFRFINGYRTILNCPADCQTRNIIYVMTCPCGDYEYIGETSQRLSDRLWYHRQHLNRIIHEFLIGERNVQLSRMQEKDYETLVKDRMLLYKHAARCSWIIQIFLNFNPIYWCFVPITMNEAIQESRNYVLPSSIILFDSINPTSIGSKDRQAIPETADTRSDETTRSCMRYLPPVPPGYTFSTGQRIQQFQYFKNKQDIKTKPDDYIDLFNVAFIAVLPVDASETVRRFVESLFITHTEAKLNTSGRLLHQDDNDNNNDDNNGNMPAMSTEVQIIDREIHRISQTDFGRDLQFSNDNDENFNDYIHGQSNIIEELDNATKTNNHPDLANQQKYNHKKISEFSPSTTNDKESRMMEDMKAEIVKIPDY